MKRLLLYGLFLILLLETTPYVHYLGFGPGLSFKNLSLYLFVLVIGLRAVLSPNGIRFSDLDVHAACLVLILYSVVSFSVLFAFDPTYPTLRAFIELKSQVIDYYLFFLVYRYGIDTLEDALWLFNAIMRTLLVLGILIAADYLNVPNLGVFGTFQGRTEGFLGEPNEYAAFLVFTMPMLFVAISSVFPKRRLFWWGAFVLTTFIFIATGSRGGFLAAIVGFLGGAGSFAVTSISSSRPSSFCWVSPDCQRWCSWRSFSSISVSSSSVSTR